MKPPSSTMPPIGRPRRDGGSRYELASSGVAAPFAACFSRRNESCKYAHALIADGLSLRSDRHAGPRPSGKDVTENSRYKIIRASAPIGVDAIQNAFWANSTARSLHQSPHHQRAAERLGRSLGKPELF